MVPEREEDKILREKLNAENKSLGNDIDGIYKPNRKERRAKDKNKNYEIGHYQRIRNNDTHYHK